MFGNTQCAMLIFGFFHFGLSITSFRSHDQFIADTKAGDSTVPNRNITFISAKRHTNTSSVPKFVIPEGYKKENRPTFSNEPILVWFDIHVIAINPIKAADMDFRIDMTLSQRWIDSRLNFSDAWFEDTREFFILPLEYTDQIWQPDPYIVNAKSTGMFCDVGQLTQKLVSVYIFRNQTVHYITNVFATVACAMSYKYYPYDHQICPIYLKISTVSYDETQVKYLWAEEEDAFTINTKLRMLQFQVTRPLHFHETAVHRYLEAKNFSQLIACFRFDRLLGNHIIQTFVPCSLIVCLSWFSFWLELNALSARMSLVVTSILTLVTQFVGLKADVPPVAYVKAVDIWMAGCLICVFGSLGEYVLVKVLYSFTEDVKFHYYEKKRYSEEAEETNGDIILDENDFHTMSYRRNKSSQPPHLSNSFAINNKNPCHQKSLSLDEPALLEKVVFGKIRIPLQWSDTIDSRHRVLLWRQTDNFSKWFFPLAFCIFCTFYWLILYLHHSSTKVQPYSRKIYLYRSACLEE